MAAFTGSPIQRLSDPGEGNDALQKIKCTYQELGWIDAMR